MNRKSRLCLFSCTVLVVLMVGEIGYLQLEGTVSKKEIIQKKAFVKTTMLCDFSLALKNNSIKTLP